MDYLVFQTESESVAAAEAIYANMVEAIDSPDLLDVSNGQVVPKDSLTPEQTVLESAEDRHFPVFGKNAATGIKDETTGYTTAWASAQQTLQGQWVFEKPEDSLLVGVVGYTVEPYNPNWFQQYQ
jgi:hypothetical protein